jgi:hypothetical protein
VSTTPDTALQAASADHRALQLAEERIGYYIGAQKTANEANARLKAENVRLQQDLRAAEGRAELIDNHALLLQDQVAEQGTAIETALTDLRGVLRRWPRGVGERELADIRHAYATLSGALAATAPEEGAC